MFNYTGDIFNFDKESYQVAVLSTLILPFPNLVHCYFATKNPKGEISRLEIPGYFDGAIANSRPTFNRFEVEEGYLSIPSVVGMLHGNKNSLACKLYNFLHQKNLVDVYPFSDEYNPFGPNSNTFIQWGINATGLGSRLILPNNALGKDYRGLRELEERLYSIAAE